MPLQYTGVLDEHRACRSAAVVFDVSHLGHRRLPMRGRGARRAAVVAHQRSRPHRARTRAVHTPARSRRRARGRRHHRVVGRTRAFRRDAERIEHRPARRCRGEERAAGDRRRGRVRPTSREPRRGARGAGARRASAARAGQRRSRRGASGSRCARLGGATRGSSPAPGTPAKTAWRSTWRPTTRPSCGTRCSARGHHAGRTRRARHAPARSGPPVARPRARTRDHAVASRARLGRALGQRRFPRSRAARSRTQQGSGAPAHGRLGRGSAPGPRRCHRAARRRRDRRGHQRQLLADARKRDRAGVACGPTSSPARPCSSTCAARCSTARSSSRRS